MLRHASCMCRAVLLPAAEAWPQDAAASSVTMQYAACSLLKALTAGQMGLGGVQQQQQQQQQQRCMATAAGDAPAAATGSGIVIDQTAVQRLKELQAEAPGRQVMLRVEVEGGGCSGFQYKFRLDDATSKDDLVFEQDGVRVVCDTVSLDFLRGAVVEYEDSLMRSAFQISVNPNSESTCGCGTSFVAKI